MRRLMRAAALVAALVCATTAQAQAPAPTPVPSKTFVNDELASDAVRLEDKLKTEGRAAVAGKPGPQLRREAETALGRGNARGALALFTAAIAADPRDPANWLGYVRAARAIPPKDYEERSMLAERATTAAYAAFQRAATRADEAAALALLGEVYAGREDWRPALNALRASLQAVDDPRVRQTYEDLREKHGFRITNYTVDSDAASPRACFQFSEPLASGKVDFTPYIAVSGAANAAVTTEGSQLCIDGLKHGERYAFVLRQGLPSSVGETLLKSADYEIYVRDRSPQARFTGRNYVLPRTGQEGIPVVSVNTSQVAIDIYRIGDRNLLPTLRSDDFLSQLSGSSAQTIAKEKGQKIWSGTFDTKSELNRDVVTAFPVTEAVGPLEPGVYVMTARPPGKPRPAGEEDEDDYGRRATQWFVVSDLGLTALKGQDGVHVLVRSLASAEPLPRVQVRLIA
ncbi:MAG TPA: alpha-2-macroglobulin family protein, partial [Beijerinckiaceae bacterium]|nr:alpha-2-macroglobulin family protein [Beijerinckiaceae bacterium]